MDTKTKFNKGQHNEYTTYPDGSHDHAWYRPSTGQMGYHAEHCSDYVKYVSGSSAKERATSIYNTSSHSDGIYHRDK